MKTLVLAFCAVLIGISPLVLAKPAPSDANSSSLAAETESANSPSARKDKPQQNIEVYTTKLNERHTARITELNNLRSIAAGENAKKTVAAIDELIARENKLYKTRLASSRQRQLDSKK